MSSREVRKAARDRTKNYFKSVKALRSAHRKLFDTRGSKSIVERRIGSARTGLLLIEAALRLTVDDPRTKSLATGFFLELLEEFSEGHNASTFKILITCNVILSRRQEDNTRTYSVFYGQSFAPLGDDVERDQDDFRDESADPLGDRLKHQSKTQVADSFEARNAEEFTARFPDKLAKEAVIERFQNGLNDTSNVVVERIINVVVLYLAALDAHPAHDPRLGVPRLELA